MISTCNDDAAVFGYRAAYPQTLDCLDILDAALEMHVAEGLPYYRIWLIERDVPASRLAALPPYFSLIAHEANGGAQRFTAKLPEDRSSNTTWGLASDWTLCLSCVGYTNDGQPDSDNPTRLTNALEIAYRRSGYDPSIGIEFTDAPPAEIVVGSAALDRVEEISGTAVPRSRDYTEVANEYLAFIADYEKVSLVKQLECECGRVSYGFFTSGLPGEKTSAQLIDESREKIDAAKRDIANFEACAAGFLQSFDKDGLASQLAAASAQERALAVEAGYVNGVERRKISVDAEMAAVRKFIARQQRNGQEEIRDKLQSIDSNTAIVAYQKYERTRPRVDYAPLIANATTNFNREVSQLNQNAAPSPLTLRSSPAPVAPQSTTTARLADQPFAANPFACPETIEALKSCSAQDTLNWNSRGLCEAEKKAALVTCPRQVKNDGTPSLTRSK
ncbi:MAG: hypothetical protein AAFV62_03385 [Pseudomonadota bacterium]